MPGVHELRIALTVDDFDAAVAFYRDALGLEVRDAWNRSNGRGMILEAGRATLELFDQQQAETLDAIEVGRRTSGTIRFAIHVDDAGAAAEELVEAGATLEAAAAVTPWGDRNARVRTPDGMQMTLFTPTPGASEDVEF
ncbi:MAG TPA: VOC family protein [Candidatus Limnocylindrales bacterium]|jgi:methylmalonyl-CoA/ethylmalonyl-CoA epimerase|nr:VOC family protein [Candidatus Limnocylindrales bacterium]